MSNPPNNLTINSSNGTNSSNFTNPSSPAISITSASNINPISSNSSNSTNSHPFKSRSRAGTLPSSFLNTPTKNLTVNPLQVNSNYHNNNSSSNGPISISNSNSPLVTSSQNYDVLNLPHTMDSISLGISPSPSSHAIDIPNANSSIIPSINNGNSVNNNNSTSTSINPSFTIPVSNSRRMRSGSLFSTNSIWNDDALSVHSSSQHSTGLLDNSSLHSFDNNAIVPTITGGSNTTSNGTANTTIPSSNNATMNGTSATSTYLSPIISAQNSTSTTNNASVNTTNINLPPSAAASAYSSAPRNRSYTTTATIPNLNLLPISNYMNHESQQLSSNNVPSNNNNINGNSSRSPFMGGVSTKTNEMNFLLDNLMLNQPTPTPANSASSTSNIPRHRSQTYSGSTPVIPESSLNQPQSGMYPQPQQQSQPQFLSQQQYQQFQQQQQHQHQTQDQQQQQQQSQQQHLQQNDHNHYGNEQPVLLDDFDFSQIAITTNFENPSLGPTKFLLIDNLPQFIDSMKLWNILNNSLNNQRSFASIRGIRIASTTSSKHALIECANLDISMSLKASFTHLELIPGIILYVAFAKIVDNNSDNTGTRNGVVNVSDGPGSNSIPTAILSTTNNSDNISPNATNGNGGPTKSNIVVNETVKPSPTDLLSIQQNLMTSITKLTSKSNYVDINKIISIVNKSLSYPKENYQNNFGPLPDPIPLRQFDSPKLRELRKILENNENALNNSNRSPSPKPSPNPTPVNINGGGSDNTDEEESLEHSNKVLSQFELEELCLAMLDELPELCYDYLGNTIVQKLFALVESPLIKLMMVKEIAPFLTQLSIHKNGTWAIQKIINVCHDDLQQKYLIGASLKPYAVKLFNDQFGNYVLQGCTKFGSPFNDFIFEVMLDNFMEISFGRFGARSIRTILETANENNFITNEQIVLVAALIVEFANELVINNNGSLLITWFLDTFNDKGATIDDRYILLTNKFLPNLEALCTHKLANLTVLKILNNRADLNSKQLIMDTIFGKFQDSYELDHHQDDNTGIIGGEKSKLLELILTENHEHSAGPLFIYKILTNPFLLTLNDANETSSLSTDSNLNSKYQQYIVSQIRRILLELNITNFQPYKKLMDEVGLSSNRLNRSNSSNNKRKRNPNGGRSQHNQHHNHQSQQQQQQYNQQKNMLDHNQPMMGGYGMPQYYMTPQPYQSQQQQQQQQQQAPPQQQQQQGGYPMMMPNQYMPQGMNTQGNFQGNPPQLYQPMNQYQYQHEVYPQQMQQSLQSQPQSQQSQQDMAVMQQLEQLSLSSAALGYNSNPGTPGVSSSGGQSSFF